ncbi:TRAP transporter large permease [Variovorax ginsengisoli]|uniref:TRAP transporter large permease protein n=1 Tax=Variovorax ginsengisoli TaxID=363844 RepID=A0ABT8RXD3_9BURK|nr:TRAP transporter large permease [Variovorax ginsengisoli]MDN8611985.1 TRAP transporter large permease [Variovorax ginsengisoli]MDO1531155.1 TRAP transporter large permease [Variovorax ginsengisoli]
MIALALLVLLVVGVPVGVAFALIVMVRAEAWSIELSSLASIPYDTVSSFPLLAIPLFLLGGELMNRGGLIRQLTAVCDILLGWVRAPLGHVMILASALMGAITGSSVATVAAIGGTVGREMSLRGYPRGYTAALNASAGLLGVLIPPSIPLILYGSIVGVSITQLFLASVMPGIVMMLALGVVHAWMSRHVLPGGQELVAGAQPTTHAAVDGRMVQRSMAAIMTRSIPALMLPVLVLGGIYSGIFTPTEAAAVAALYALLVTVLGRMTKFGELNGIFARAALSSAAILVIIGFTSIFNRAMVLEQVPQSIAGYATGFTDSALVFLLVVNLVLLLIGMFMETNAATLLMGPLLAPAAAKFGIDPVHFAIILVTNIEIGLLTPPMAANLYVAARTNNADLVSLLRYLGWFLVAALLVMATITYVPQLSLWYRYFF